MNTTGSEQPNADYYLSLPSTIFIWRNYTASKKSLFNAYRGMSIVKQLSSRYIILINTMHRSPHLGHISSMQCSWHHAGVVPMKRVLYQPCIVSIREQFFPGRSSLSRWSSCSSENKLPPESTRFFHVTWTKNKGSRLTLFRKLPAQERIQKYKTKQCYKLYKQRCSRAFSKKCWDFADIWKPSNHPPNYQKKKFILRITTSAVTRKGDDKLSWSTPREHRRKHTKHEDPYKKAWKRRVNAITKNKKDLGIKRPWQ